MKNQNLGIGDNIFSNHFVSLLALSPMDNIPSATQVEFILFAIQKEFIPSVTRVEFIPSVTRVEFIPSVTRVEFILPFQGERINNYTGRIHSTHMWRMEY